jgi:hypothetical protein
LDTTGQPLGLSTGSGQEVAGGAEYGVPVSLPDVAEARGFLLWLLQKFVETGWLTRHDVRRG